MSIVVKYKELFALRDCSYSAHSLFIHVDIAAYPDSVNVLEGFTDDIRTPDKLITGDKEPGIYDHMWLAPILPSIVSIPQSIIDVRVIYAALCNTLFVLSMYPNSLPCLFSIFRSK